MHTLSAAVSKDEILRNVTKRSSEPDFAYRADIVSTVSVQEQTSIDSGYIRFSPPDWLIMEMHVSGTKVVSVGDTTWTTMPTGAVTRTVGEQTPGALMGAGQAPGQVPNMAAVLRNGEFRIVAEQPPNKPKSLVRLPDAETVTIEFDMPIHSGTCKARATYDTEKWLVRTFTLLGGPVTTMESAYSYIDFEGHTMVSAVHMVMGAAGFMKVLYRNYRKTEKLSRDQLEGF